MVSLKLKSCVTNLLEIIDLITEALNRVFYVVMILLDFTKAFDKVVHSFILFINLSLYLLFLLKISAYGFNSQIVAWIDDFLRNSKQREVLGENISDWLDVLNGSPQGACISPLLSIIYINDMPDVVCRR